MSFAETSVTKRALVQTEMGNRAKRRSLSIEIDAINAQAAKVEVIAKEYKDLLCTHHWTKQMIEGLNRALLSVGIEIKPVKDGPTKEPLHTKGFEAIHLEGYKKSDSFQILGLLFPEAESNRSENSAEIAAKKALITQRLHEEVAKISVMIQDFIGESHDPRLSQDALLSLNYALQLNGHQLARAKACSKDLFMQLADDDYDLNELLAVVQSLLCDLTDFGRKEVDLALMDKLTEKDYPAEILKYVKVLACRATSYDQAQKQLASDKSHYIAILKRRSQESSFLISLLEDAIEELEIDLEKLEDNRPNEHKVAVSQEQFLVAIDSSTRANIFSMNAFSMRYSQTKSPNIFQYITAITSLVGTQNFNSEQMKRQMRRHFEKLQQRAKEKDKEVRAQREKAKQTKVRLERQQEKDKRFASKEKAATVAAATKEKKGLFSKLFAKVASSSQQSKDDHNQTTGASIATTSV